MSGRYVPVPNPLTHDAEREMDAAFQSDDEYDEDGNGETTPLNPRNTSPPSPTVTSRLRVDVSGENDRNESPTVRVVQHRRQTLPGTYDFEADPFDYAVPPPGSPPGPTSYALPNQYGNSNGIIPTNPAIPSYSGGSSSNFFRRTVGALLPSYYQRVPTSEGHSVPSRGAGINNDGVFANITAKPSIGRVVQDGESIHVVPEDAQKEAPPSYAVAQADQAPAYYETVIHAPSLGLDGEILVEGMPTGSLFTFAWTMLISLSFQFVGFLLTYLLHTTHASKFGSRAGLGITIIQYAFFLRRRAALGDGSYDESSADVQSWFDTTGDNDFSSVLNGTMMASGSSNVNYSGYFSAATTEWLSFFLMSVGWFILLTSLLGYWRVKRWERGLRNVNEPSSMTPEVSTPAADRNVVINPFTLFGIPIPRHDDREQDENGLEISTPVGLGREHSQREATEHDLRLQRDLRNAGLI
ncbi:hypothetical protein Clacol_002435 [Clathrus columnatus]|uniref:Metal homeostatis protein bsd2 n=1 Tax=Clathrus columnatus TaxID=1419009 RepID=A0AAV5A6Q3_9AGAM|nr:hypothetical protein Clacol_002435 [Clathrus columnatus]